MGMFDFTYADNGRNIRGGSGYLYVSRAFAKATGIKSPMPFSYLDEYGNITYQNRNMPAPVMLDLYAIYTAMLALESELDMNDAVRTYINQLRYHIEAADNEVSRVSDEIRTSGITYFFDHMKTEQDAMFGTVSALGNQREKHVTYFERFIGKIPLLISRKKLPAEPGDDITDIARNWGYVSTDDPKQGCGPTRNLYAAYQPGR